MTLRRGMVATALKAKFAGRPLVQPNPALLSKIVIVVSWNSCTQAQNTRASQLYPVKLEEWNKRRREFMIFDLFSNLHTTLFIELLIVVVGNKTNSTHITPQS